MGILQEPLVFVDVETTGLNHLKGRVIEVAAIRVEEGRVVHEFHSLVDPGFALPQFTSKLTGITQQHLAGAPIFLAIAADLQEVLQNAIFVAHNVRFDYSFLKQEFKRIGHGFQPRQLCTMRLSRALYPTVRGHSLKHLIVRHNLHVTTRHRAYDDAHALWQFVQRMCETFSHDELTSIIGKQLKQPALPKALSPDIIASLPTGVGVYIFYDEAGLPLYVGKSIHIRQRVMEHFSRDHDNIGEFKLSQRVHHITAEETSGELEALLLESQLIKQLLPYQNKLLRRQETLLLLVKETDTQGYWRVRLEASAPETAYRSDTVLAVYDRRSVARASLERAAREWNLCPKLLGLEKTNRACFWSQLGTCRGACTNQEVPEAYNQRLELAFGRQQLTRWPYKGPILLQEKSATHQNIGFIIDRWCILGKLRHEEHCEPVFERQNAAFDLDTYKILSAYLSAKPHKVSIQPLSAGQLQSLEV